MTALSSTIRIENMTAAFTLGRQLAGPRLTADGRREEGLE